MRYVVKEETKLMDFLLLYLSRKQVKHYLKFKLVHVNKKPISQFDYVLEKGDFVELKKDQKAFAFEILYEDKDIIVINKPAGMLSVAGGGEKEQTAFHIIAQHLKQKDKSSRVFVVHRLDKETSGVLMFAKNEKIKNLFQSHWNELAYNREYVAIVEGHLAQKRGRIENYLEETKTQQVYISKGSGKLAITNYEVCKESKEYSFVKVQLETGRKNQIRVHMQSLGHSIVNDRKYGAQSNPLKRLGLHCYRFGILHPITKEKMEFEATIPSCFHELF